MLQRQKNELNNSFFLSLAKMNYYFLFTFFFSSGVVLCTYEDDLSLPKVIHLFLATVYNDILNIRSLESLLSFFWMAWRRVSGHGLPQVCQRAEDLAGGRGILSGGCRGSRRGLHGRDSFIRGRDEGQFQWRTNLKMIFQQMVFVGDHLRLIEAVGVML